MIRKITKQTKKTAKTDSKSAKIDEQTAKITKKTAKNLAYLRIAAKLVRIMRLLFYPSFLFEEINTHGL